MEKKRFGHRRYMYIVCHAIFSLFFSGFFPFSMHLCFLFNLIANERKKKKEQLRSERDSFRVYLAEVFFPSKLRFNIKI